MSEDFETEIFEVNLFFFVKFTVDSPSAHVTNLSDHPDGPSNFDGTAETGRGTDGGEDDADHDHVSTDQAANGGVRVSQGLHPTQQG